LTLSTEHEQDSLYRDHLAEIIGLREKCDGLIDVLHEGEAEVGEMMKALEYVEERSESLRGACEDLLEEQVSDTSTWMKPLMSRRTSSRIRRSSPTD
jgi:endonuclease III